MFTLPAYALFRHPDGSWYRLWVTQTTPKTERGHPWHLHASYDKTGTIAPIACTLWYEQPYGMANWDFETEEDVRTAFLEKSAERIAHGYELREGTIPE
jgi:hypothetical protein